MKSKPKSDEKPDKDAPAPRKVPLWRRLKAGRLTWVLVGGGVLGLIVAGVLFASDPNSVFSLKSGAGKTQGPASAEPKVSDLIGAKNLDPADPALHFAETKMGQVLFTTSNSDSCNRVLFDNSTGTSYWTKTIDCGRPVEEAKASEAPNRALAIQKSFKR